MTRGARPSDRASGERAQGRIDAPRPRPLANRADGRIVIDGATLPALPEDEPELDERVSGADVDAALEAREAWEAGRQETVRTARDELFVIPPAATRVTTR